MYPPSVIDPNLEDRLRAELEQGERLIWSGQPRRGAYARRMIPAGLAGLAFILFGLAAAFMVANSGPTPPPPDVLAQMPPEERARWQALSQPDAMDRVLPFIFGGAFGLFGLPLALIPLLAWFAAGRTAYALTDRAIIIQQGNLSGGYTTRRYTAQALRDIRRVERSSGVGDLIFESAPGIDGSATGSRAPNTRAGFHGVDGVREVEQLLKKTLRIPNKEEPDEDATGSQESVPS